jgi:hypothetical protein
VGVMHITRLTYGIIVLLFLSSFFIVNTINANESIDTFVDGTFNIELVTATYFDIAVTLDVNKITVFGETYNSEEIQTLASSTKISDIEDMGAIKQKLIQLLDNQITATFEEESVGNLGKKPTYKDGAFHHDYYVNLTPSFFDMTETVNINDFVNGVLDLGALINYSIDLHAEAGWNNTYNIVIGEHLDYQRTTGILSGNMVSWFLNNWDGNKPSRIAEIQIKKIEPTNEKLETDDIFLEFILDSEEPETISLISNILLKSIDIRTYSILPSFISNLDFINSDGIRLFVGSGLITWEGAYQTTVQPLEQIIKTTIEESSFNQTFDISFNWENETTDKCIIPYEIDNMDNNPPVQATLIDNDVNLQICDISARALFGLINTGGNVNISKDDINFGEGLKNIGYDYNVSLYLPEGLYLDEENIYSWNESISYFGKFESDNSATYDDQEKNTIIIIEVTNTDLNLLSFFTGTTELTVGLDFEETRNYNITELPKEFSLPEKLIINYLNSDAFRLCIEEDVFSQDEVDTFLKNERTAFESTLKSVISKLEVRASIKENDFEKSLDWDGNILRMDALNPVKVKASAHSSYPISFNFGLLPPKFNIPSIKFNFSGMEDYDVTYKIIFPNDVSLSVSDSQNKSYVKEMSDGREYVEISFGTSEANLSVAVSCKITPSALFILGVLTPCVVSFIITIILIILILIIRKKRRGRKAVTGPMIDDSDSSSYEDEDYYTPPPPRSK